MSTRRGFLKMLGIGAAAAPMAPAAVGDLTLSGVNVAGMGGLHFGGEAVQNPATSLGYSQGWVQRKVAELMSPSAKAERWQNTNVFSLDPDLHALRSMSLGSKIAIQRQRNFERSEASARSYVERLLRGDIE